MTDQAPKKSEAQRSEEKARYFDAQLFGLLIRRARMDLGLSTADAFSEEVERETGLKVPRDTLYRIETGKTQPSIEQAIAISLTLRDKNRKNGYIFDGLYSCLRLAVCGDWLDAAYHGNVSANPANRESSIYDEDIPF